MIVALVIMRDRVTYAKQCVEALTHAGLDVHIVDHGTTWEPALEWLSNCGLPVHRRGDQHPRSLWEWELLEPIVGDNRYIVTDCDVLPTCPPNWLEMMGMMLDVFPNRVKVGLGLLLDDLPAHYEYREQVHQWEAAYQNFFSDVDTTLAMYRPLGDQPEFALGPSIRMGLPYVARHLPWYEDSANESEELRYYREHALLGASHWLDPERYTANA